MSDELQNELEPVPTPVKRPGGLTLICILTFIFSGSFCVSNLFYGLNYNYLPQYTHQYIELLKTSPFFKGVLDIETMTDAIKVLTETSIWFYILNALLYGVSLAGAIVMFNLKKVGFHLYAVAQILLLILPLAFLHGFKTDFSNITITIVFIAIYYTNVRLMK